LKEDINDHFPVRSEASVPVDQLWQAVNVTTANLATTTCKQPTRWVVSHAIVTQPAQ